MCAKCNNTGYISEEVGDGQQLKFACPECNRQESERARAPRRQPTWLTELSKPKEK